MTTPHLYADQYRDAESGHYYLRARYYDLATAQFLPRDPVTPSVLDQAMRTHSPVTQILVAAIAVGALMGGVTGVRVGQRSRARRALLSEEDARKLVGKVVTRAWCFGTAVFVAGLVTVAFDGYRSDWCMGYSRRSRIHAPPHDPCVEKVTEIAT